MFMRKDRPRIGGQKRVRQGAGREDWRAASGSGQREKFTYSEII